MPGRKQTTGRFETREELEAVVLDRYARDFSGG